MKRNRELLNSFLQSSIKEVRFGIWNDFKKGKVYVSQDYEKGTPFIFSLTLDDFEPNIMMLKTLKRYYFWKSFEQNFNLGLVYYENQFIKVNMLEAVKICKAI